MRLITDENISWRLKRALPDWDIVPSNEIKSGTRLTYLMIWQYAKQHSYTILTFDEDFAELQNLNGFPPKIIWLRLGNTLTNEIATLLIRLQEAIISFLNNDDLGIYEIYPWS